MVYIPKKVKLIKTKKKGRALLANQNFKKGESVLPLNFEKLSKYKDASDDSLQVDEDKFLDSKHFYVSDFVNHGCDPNVRIFFPEKCSIPEGYVAIRDIKKGEEISFNYNTTEWDFARDNLDFECECKSRNCLGRVKGFKFLTKEQKIRLKPFLSPYILKKL